MSFSNEHKHQSQQSQSAEQHNLRDRKSIPIGGSAQLKFSSDYLTTSFKKEQITLNVKQTSKERDLAMLKIRGPSSGDDNKTNDPDSSDKQGKSEHTVPRRLRSLKQQAELEIERHERHLSAHSYASSPLKSVSDSDRPAQPDQELPSGDELKNTSQIPLTPSVRFAEPLTSVTAGINNTCYYHVLSVVTLNIYNSLISMPLVVIFPLWNLPMSCSHGCTNSTLFIGNTSDASSESRERSENDEHDDALGFKKDRIRRENWREFEQNQNQAWQNYLQAITTGQQEYDSHAVCNVHLITLA